MYSHNTEYYMFYHSSKSQPSCHLPSKSTDIPISGISSTSAAAAYPSYSQQTFLLKLASVKDLRHCSPSARTFTVSFVELLPSHSSLNLLSYRSFTLLVTFQTVSDDGGF